MENYNNARRAAEVHRQARLYARKTIRPGMSMLSVADTIEDATRVALRVVGEWLTASEGAEVRHSLL